MTEKIIQRMLTVEQVANYLNMPVATLRNRSCPKSKYPLPKMLRPMRVLGRRLMWDRRKIDQYLDSIVE
ncbi:MAG: helix-turn-helix domain-containing protein [Desulfobacteraceae bacterium]|nr:helix-turn-helix domain-containing protein [Desulfobacteraceae bacterium]